MKYANEGVLATKVQLFAVTKEASLFILPAGKMSLLALIMI